MAVERNEFRSAGRETPFNGCIARRERRTVDERKPGPDGPMAESVQPGRRHPTLQATNFRTRAALSRRQSCSAQDWPTVADGALAPYRNLPAAGGRLRAFDGRIPADPCASTSRGGAVFVASPNNVSRRRSDERRQPPERLRGHSRKKPGTPNYGFGWSATSWHLLRSSQSQKRIRPGRRP